MNVEQKRRELFEAWWISENRQMYVRDTKCLTFDFIQAFRVWSAALDAVVIELPDVTDVFCKETVHACRTAIESTGLGLKVKP